MPKAAWVNLNNKEETRVPIEEAEKLLKEGWSKGRVFVPVEIEYPLKDSTSYDVTIHNEEEWSHKVDGKEFILPFSQKVYERFEARCFNCGAHAGSGMSWCRPCKKILKPNMKSYASATRQISRKLSIGFWNTQEDPKVKAASVATLKKKIADDPKLHDQIYKHGKKRLGKEVWVARFKEIHDGKYDYSLVNEDVQYSSNIEIICPTHGKFTQDVQNHITGHGCKQCQADGHRLTQETFLERSKEHHGDKYDYSLVEYISTNEGVKIICPVHGEFEQLSFSHMTGSGCSKCALNGPSKQENEVFQYVESLGFAPQQSRRDLMHDRKEIDIFVPELNIGIEFNGIFWHSDKFKHKDYHLKKYQAAKDVGIRLITIFEDEWLRSPAKVKNALRSLLGKQEKGLGARHYKIREIDSKTANDFLDRYHLQGRTRSKHYIALMDEEIPIAVMAFGSPTRQSKYQYELKRFSCDALKRPGAASRLFKFFVQKYKPENIVSFSDRRWFDGSVYPLLGFENTGSIGANYNYCLPNGERYHSSKFTRAGIKSKHPEVYSEYLTEFQMMDMLPYLRLWDCGKDRWVWDQ